MKLTSALILTAVAIVVFAVVYGVSKNEEPLATDEIAVLRQEVAALRDEVAQLHDDRDWRKAMSGANLGTGAGTPGSLADIAEQLKSMRVQHASEQSELASNLVEITVNLGSDAWARGDFRKAMKLLKPLAEAGQPIAEHRVGVMYMLGQGVPRDAQEAIKWFSKAAEQGQGESQHSLGLRYLWGDGVDKDPQTAANWFLTAANQGIPDSATWLADMYWTGSGVQADPVEAYKWMILAGDKFSINHPNGMTLDQFASQLTPQQKAEAEQRAKGFSPQRTGPEDF